MKMILGIYGYHNSGKTELVEKLVERLTSKDYRVATIKNIPREFSIDTEKKDTWRHKKAGAEVVVASSLNETTFIFGRNMALDEIFTRLEGYDVILVEGYKKSGIPKVAVGDIKGGENTIFRYEDNLDEILDFIERGIKMEKNKKSADITVEVDGKKVPMNRFSKRITANTIQALVSSLRGTEDAKEIKIELRI